MRWGAATSAVLILTLLAGTSKDHPSGEDFSWPPPGTTTWPLTLEFRRLALDRVVAVVAVSVPSRRERQRMASGDRAESRSFGVVHRTFPVDGSGGS